MDASPVNRSPSYHEGCPLYTIGSGSLHYGTIPEDWGEARSPQRTTLVDRKALDDLRDALAGHRLLRSSNVLLVVVFVALFCDYALNSMAVPILPTFLRRLHIEHSAIGLLFAAKPGAQVAGNAAAGPLIHHLGAPATLLTGLVVLSAATAVFGQGLSLTLTPNLTYGLLLIARGVQGLSSAFVMASGMTWIAQTHSPTKRGLAMGTVLIGVGAGAMCGAGLAGFIAILFGDAAPFYGMTGLLSLTAGVVLLLLQRPLSGRSGKGPDGGGSDRGSAGAPDAALDWPQIRRLLRLPDVACIGVLVFIGNMGITVLQPTLPLYLHSRLGYTQRGEGLVWGAMALAYLLGRPLAGALADRTRKWRILLGGLLTLSSGLFVVSGIEDVWVILAGVCMVSMGVAFVTTPCMPMMADVIELHGSQDYGVFYSLVDACTSLGMICGPLIGSLLLERLGFAWTFRAAGLLALPAGVCAAVLRAAEAQVGELRPSDA